MTTTESSSQTMTSRLHQCSCLSRVEINSCVLIRINQLPENDFIDRDSQLGKSSRCSRTKSSLYRNFNHRTPSYLRTQFYTRAKEMILDRCFLFLFDIRIKVLHTDHHPCFPSLRSISRLNVRSFPCATDRLCINKLRCNTGATKQATHFNAQLLLQVLQLPYPTNRIRRLRC